MNVLRSFADICSTSTTLVYIFLQILRGQSQLLNVSSLPRHPTIQDFKNAQNFFRISWARPSGPSCPLWTRLGVVGGSEALRLRHVSETWGGDLPRMHLDTWRISSPQEQLGRENVEDSKFQTNQTSYDKIHVFFRRVTYVTCLTN